jgi:hypothetical protein
VRPAADASAPVRRAHDVLGVAERPGQKADQRPGQKADQRPGQKADQRPGQKAGQR